MTERTVGEYVRAKEAALLIGVSVRTIWRWGDKAPADTVVPFPKPIRLSRTVTVFPREEILNFVKARARANS